MSTKFDEPTCSKYAAQTAFDNTLAQEILLYFKPLDELLKCHICFEYYNTCMITKCCHTFCSLCIRKYMTYKAQCPECFQETTEPELRINRGIDDIIQIYHKIRAFVQSHVETAIGLKDDLSLSDTSDIFHSTQVPAEFNDSAKFSNPEHKVGVSSVAQPVASSPACEEHISIEPNKKVPCPVCSIMVHPEKINAHLDRCLVEQEKPATSSKRKPLTKVVYHLLSDKEIKKRLKEHGLSMAGNRQTLIKRHRSFILLYNSECDKLNPRPVSEILKQVENEEAEIQKVEPSKVFQSGKKSSPIAIQEENESYVKQHKNQFDALLNDVRMRQLREGSGRSYRLSSSSSSEKSETEYLPIPTATIAQNHPTDSKSTELGNQSPDLFESSPVEDHCEDSGLIDFLVDTVEETDDPDTSGLAFEMGSSDNLDDFVTTKSNSRNQRVLKRKITNRSSSSVEDRH